MTSASGLDFRLRPELVALGEEARAFGRSWSETLDIREDSWLRGTSTAFAAAMGARGWLGMCWPTEVGGGGRSALERFVVVEALISEGAPLASCWFADRQIGPTLLQFGTPEQREEFLPDIVAGRSTWCIGMSEPDAGSDVASLRTSAHRDGDGWVINGSKVWTSGAASADWCYVIARTDPQAPPQAGLSEFIVDMRSPGIEVRPIRDMTDDSHFCEVRFVDVVVAEKRRVGTLNGAFRQIMRQMEHERGGIDRLVSNRRLYLDVVASMGETVRAPDWADRFARLESKYQIGRLMVLREVCGMAFPGFSAVTKTWCTEFEIEVAEFIGSALGPAAMAYPAETTGLGRRAVRNICYAPGYTIMGGTTQILRNICAERILGLPRV